ncbi:hypothetical protein GCM10017744_060390 [Streptomyces antimycoticus]|uniref:Uncharacterized protein n=1 Tax=Streptomyces antimycoticus TaxID=68175 RepID=A0A4D4K979_9ACTN|nr:hypothetical protein SANT12839_041780 [Streptomyces antimycoticus]
MARAAAAEVRWAVSTPKGVVVTVDDSCRALREWAGRHSMVPVVKGDGISPCSGSAGGLAM